MKEHQRGSSKQDEVVWQSGKQSDRCLFHQDQNFGLVFLQVPVEIPADSLLEVHLQNTLYMVVFEIIYNILFSLTTLYDGICQYPTKSSPFRTERLIEYSVISG